MSEAKTVAVLPGDGVGPEVTTAALSVLTEVCDKADVSLTVGTHLVGGAAIDETGNPLPDETLEACRNADAVFLGAVGGPKWDHLRGAQRCESGLLRLRSELGLFANLRPVRVHPSLTQQSSLRSEIIAGVDMVVVRELTGGLYFGEPKRRDGSGPDETAVDTMVYSRREVDRIARVAFDLARQRKGHLISVDKANVLTCSQLWRDVVNEVAKEYTDVKLEHALVDSFAMQLVRAPQKIDVVVAENLFGDILSDEAGVLVASLGLLPSASLGSSGPGMYEPIHGSAPDIAGQSRANPLGAILSVALMLRHSFGRADLAEVVESAVDQTITDGVTTPDVGGSAKTEEVTASVVAALNVSAKVEAAS